LAGLFGAGAMLVARGGLRACPPAQRMPAAVFGFVGGVAGRAALLMFAARHSGSAALAAVQAPLLLPLAALLCARGLLRRLPALRAPCLLPALCGLGGLIEGFAGAGGLLLISLFDTGGVRRRQRLPGGGALLCCLCAQGGALLLTHLSGQAQVFPGRPLLLLALGAAAGAAGAQRQRGTLPRSLHAALSVLTLLAALSCLEQALSRRLLP
ncbi:MAG: hypothetical protein J6K32_13385, partial [Clostridia bacterium]|nr:hypothetical protein [Clostridia bacterium]